MAKKELDMSSPLVTNFTKSIAEYVQTTLPSQGDTLRGTVVQINSEDAWVLLDGSTVNTTAEIQTYIEVDDRVIVEIKNHQAAIIRNLDHFGGGGGGGDELPDGDNRGYGTT